MINPRWQKVIYIIFLIFSIAIIGIIFSFSKKTEIIINSKSQLKISTQKNLFEKPILRTEEIDTTSDIDEQKTYLFEGPVENIFFHPLLTYPARAFDGDSQSNGFNDWFVTVDEFKRAIEEIHKNGFALINISDLYEEKNENGIIKLVRKPLYVPVGKKPLILSVDDLNYYKYMVDNGTNAKLIIDKKGTLAALSKDDQNNDTISYDNEIIPIIDKFTEDHPDFSLNGAKGIIALTGYQGILGYRTAQTYKNYKSEQEAVKPIITALKNNGWSFASHSYFHEHINTINLTRLKTDADLWEEEVGSLTGQTNVYILPFGERPDNSGSKVSYLKSKGFYIFMGVGSLAFEKLNDDTVFILRRHLDGVALRQQRLLNLTLYDANKIIDLTIRPKR